MYLLVLGPCIPLLLALPVLLLFRSERAHLARSERAAENLFDDVMTLVSRGDHTRLRMVLESQRTPFAEGLLAILSAGDRASADLVATWRAKEGRMAGAGRALLGILAFLLMILSLFNSVLIACLFRWISGLPDALVLSLLVAIPWLPTWLAVRLARRLDRERVTQAERLERCLLKAADLLPRAPVPTNDPPTAVS